MSPKEGRHLQRALSPGEPPPTLLHVAMEQWNHPFLGKKALGTLLVLSRAEDITPLIDECREGTGHAPFTLLEFLFLLFFKYEVSEMEKDKNHMILLTCGL